MENRSAFVEFSTRTVDRDPNKVRVVDDVVPSKAPKA